MTTVQEYYDITQRADISVVLMTPIISKYSKVMLTSNAITNFLDIMHQPVSFHLKQRSGDLTLSPSHCIKLKRMMYNFQKVISCINIPSSQLLDFTEQQWLFKKLIWEKIYFVGYNSMQSSENQLTIQRNTSPPLPPDIHQTTQYITRR
jgi:hypothetical protein